MDKDIESMDYSTDRVCKYPLYTSEYATTCYTLASMQVAAIHCNYLLYTASSCYTLQVAAIHYPAIHYPYT